ISEEIEASIERWELQPWRKDARNRSEAEWDVQLCLSRAKSTSRTSTATIAHDGEQHSERDVAAVCQALRGHGSAVDTSGAIVACPAAADPLHGAEIATIYGAIKLQLIFPLVCRNGNGRSGVEPRRVQQEPGAATKMKRWPKSFFSGC